MVRAARCAGGVRCLPLCGETWSCRNSMQPANFRFEKNPALLGLRTPLQQQQSISRGSASDHDALWRSKYLREPLLWYLHGESRDLCSRSALLTLYHGHEVVTTECMGRVLLKKSSLFFLSGIRLYRCNTPQANNSPALAMEQASEGLSLRGHRLSLGRC